jgi:hypothetical protein
MHNIKFLYSLAFIALMLTACDKEGIDDDTSFVTGAPAASGVDKVITISNDNSGLVTIQPTGTGISSNTINFGHGTGAGATAQVAPGASASHIYPEGNHTITVISKDIAGRETTNTYPISVTYRAPEEVEAAISHNANSVSVKASALYASSYLVYFGDAVNEVGTPLAADGTVFHEYAAEGKYNVRVVAISGNDTYSGAAKTEKVNEVTIAPFSFRLPITFDEPGVNYFFGTFGDNQQFATVANPDPGGLNTSAKVGKFTRGHQGWSGTYSPMNQLIDLTTHKKIKVLVYIPDSASYNKQLNIELESAYKGAPGNGVGVLKVPVTKVGEWEELVFDFSTVPGLPANAKFGQLVLRFNDTSDGAGAVVYLDNFRLTN